MKIKLKKNVKKIKITKLHLKWNKGNDLFSRNLSHRYLEMKGFSFYGILTIVDLIIIESLYSTEW